MRKKLPLFLLLVLSTTLNGCSCSVEEYHSYNESYESSFSSQTISTSISSDSVSTSTTSSSRPAIDSAPDLLYKPVRRLFSYYLEDAVTNRIIINYIPSSTDSHLLRDLDFSIIGSLQGIVTYDILTDCNIDFKNSKKTFEGFYTINGSSFFLTLTRNRYMLASQIDSRGELTQTAYLLSRDDYDHFESNVWNIFKEKNPIINAELDRLDLSTTNFFQNIESLDSGNINITFDPEYWHVSATDSGQRRYPYNNKPSFYTKLKDIEFTPLADVLREKTEYPSIVFTIDYGDDFRLTLYQDRDVIRAGTEKVFTSEYFAIDYLRIEYSQLDQTQYKSFADAFSQYLNGAN